MGLIFMETEIALELIEGIKTKLERYSPDDRGYVQNMCNRHHDALSLVKDLFGLDSTHYKIIGQSVKLEPDKMRKILLNELDSIKKVLMFEDGSQASLNNIREWSLIHTDIIKVSKEKFEHGHYADSVESAFKEVNTKIKDHYKNKTGQELDGVDLMRNVFSSKSPSIILDDLTTQSGKNVQEGYGHIFAGSMQGIRNPSAHANLEISDVKAMHLLFLASLLMFTIDGKLK
jgi:uncharacterized protein (TIGR02391 family)